MSEFDFNAPKYHDFNCLVDDKGVDSFFDTDHEVTQSAPKNEKPQNSLTFLKQEVMTPEPPQCNEPNVTHPVVDDIKSEGNMDLNKFITPRVIRKAHKRLSANLQIATIPPYNMEDVLNQCMESLMVKPEKKRRTLFEGISMSVPSEKNHKMTTRLDQISKTPLLDLRSRSVVRNKVEGGDRKRRASPTLNQPQTKYMGMAERIMHFERDTPPRFHSNRKSGKFNKRQSFKPQHTVAKTPNLTALHRKRPVNEPTLAVKEEMELEEMKKNQVRALPLNKDIFKEPMVPVVVPKPTTKPYPFKLTKVTRKSIAVEEKPYNFTARPVPKAVLQSPAIKPLRERVVRLPVLERKDSSYVLTQKEVVFQGIQTRYNQKRFTEPEPFSFEERDKEMLKKKDEKIKEYLEEEKRAREFHANPLPSYSNSKPKSFSTILPTLPHAPKFKTEERIQQRHEKESNKNLGDFKPFKAQPPTVLYTKPFEPLKPVRFITDITDIELNTERRAKERELFDLTIKEREQMIECHKKERELERKKQEELEIARLRKEATHKANPVPVFKTPEIKKSTKPLTLPNSPFLTRKARIASTHD